MYDKGWDGMGWMLYLSSCREEFLRSEIEHEWQGGKFGGGKGKDREILIIKRAGA